jgi:hypothetical protein
MASASTSTHRRPSTRPKAGPPSHPSAEWRRRVEERAAAEPRSGQAEEPWSDSERVATGLAPIGEGPGSPQQQAERARSERNKQQRAQFEKDAAQRRDRKATWRNRERQVVSGGKQTASTASSGLKGLLQGKGGGTIAGTFFGLILFAMGEALLNGGPKEVAGWLGAKSLNKPYVPPASPAKAPASTKGTLVSLNVPASSGSPASIVAA